MERVGEATEYSCHNLIIASSRDEDRTCAYERCTRAMLHVRMYV